MFVKRVSSVFLVALVLAACLAVPSFANFAAGVDADGYSLIEVPYRPLYTHDDGGNIIRYSTYDDFMNGGVLYEYQGSSAYGCSLYTYGETERTSPAYGAMLKGSVLNEYFSGYDNDLYYTVAISRVSGWIGSIVKSGAMYYNYNSYTVGSLSDLGRILYGYPQNASDDDILFYFGIMSNQRYSREIIAQHEEFECCTSLFDSWDQLMTALDYAESGSESPVVPTTTEKYFSLLPGYAVAIQFQRGSVDLSYTAPSYAVRPGTTAYLGPQYYYTDGGSLPASVSFSTSYAPSTSNHNNIPFSGVPPATIDNLTRSFKASFSYDVGHSQACLVLYNPLYVPTYANAGNFVTDGSNTSSDNRVSNSIAVHISAQSISRIRLYPLESSLSSSLADGQIVSSSSDPSQVIEDVSPDASGAPSWETSGEESYNPVIGGNTLPDELTDQGLFSFLTSLFEKFASIFTWGHEALITVFNSASGFIARLGSLYSWLPPEVTAVISGCIILVLVIGLIKVLL